MKRNILIGGLLCLLGCSAPSESEAPIIIFDPFNRKLERNYESRSLHRY
jgi:hypothetical protein